MSDKPSSTFISFQLGSLALPDHWMKQFFLAHTCLELQLNEEAFRLYTLLSEKGFGHSTYVMAQIAVAYHNLRGMFHICQNTNVFVKIKILCYCDATCFTEVDMAVDQFAKLQKSDPYRLENMDTYSNLLYVKVCTLDYFQKFCIDIFYIMINSL